MEESKLYGINKIEFLKLLKNYPEIEEYMREIQYAKYRSVKNQMDNGIRKELNEFNNSINDVHNKIEFKVKEMVEFNGNKNGMNINNCLKKEIKKREERIKNLEEILNKKYDEGKKRMKEFKNKFSNIERDYKDKYQLNLDTYVNV